jgi:hypothetical protein
MTRLTTTIDKLDTLCNIIANDPTCKVVAVVKREPNVTLTTIGKDGVLGKIVTDNAVDILFTTC